MRQTPHRLEAAARVRSPHGTSQAHLRRNLRPPLARSEEAGLRTLRRGLLAGAAGRVLEIGAGTGANLGLYSGTIDGLVVAEPEAPMLRRLQKAAREHMPRAQVVQAPAEQLPFDDDAFDTVVSTLVLCGVDDQVQALQEARRVLKPAAGCCSSSTCAPTTLRSPASRTG